MFQSQFIPGDAQHPAVLQVKGDATIQNSKMFKAALVEGIKTCPDLVVDCSMVTEADISCLQLLCSAHQSCQSLKLASERSEVLQALIETAGFSRLNGCGQVVDKQNCIWISNVSVT